MRLLIGELAPRRAEVAANLERIRAVVTQTVADLAVFPELFLTGYRVGDRMLRLALSPGSAPLQDLQETARSWGHAILVGVPWASADRGGETWNAALLVRPDGSYDAQVKRFLPNYGPFEEGMFFTPAPRSAPLPVAGHQVGVEVCYDAFFPEVTRELALQGADLLVNISASPVTSRSLFQKVLPARAVENACPLVYVNRVGVEDGMVFGGGSVALDSRGEPLPWQDVPLAGAEPEERVGVVQIDLTEAQRWRPFRPVLRDVGVRPPGPRPPAAAVTGTPESTGRSGPFDPSFAGPTHAL